MKKGQKKLSVGVSLLLLCVLFSGCKSRIGDFTLITTKNIDLASFSSHREESGERVTGEDKQSIYAGLPNIKEAMDDALDKVNAYMLVDAAIYYEWFYFPIIGYSKYEVTGVPIKRKY